MPTPKTYDDYRRFLDGNGLLEKSIHRTMHEPKCRYIVDEIFAKHSFGNILEIGRAHGHTFGLWRFLSPDSHVVSIDPIHYGAADMIAELFDDNYAFIDGTSDDLVENIRKFDFVLIDGEHSYEWGKKDWGNIQDHLTPDAIVVFDDVAMMQGVGRAFEEIEEDGFRKEKIKTGPSGNPYLGIIYFK